MQIANGFVKTCPEIEHYVYGITPAEAVILKKMHNQYANGSPLKNLVITGEATEVDAYGKPMQIADRRPYSRAVASINSQGQPEIKTIADFETFHTPSTKPRTQTAEAIRLQMKYTGNIKEGNNTMKAFEAAFGSGAMVRLPETFEEVRHIIGDVFTYAEPQKSTATVANPAEPIGESLPQVPVESITTPAKRLGRPPKQPEAQQA